jgi:hypothetical protein
VGDHPGVPGPRSPTGTQLRTGYGDGTGYGDAARMANELRPRFVPRLMAMMLEAIAGHRVGDRPGRAEPRANKRRPKPQRFLNERGRLATKRLLANAL